MVQAALLYLGPSGEPFTRPGRAPKPTRHRPARSRRRRSPRRWSSVKPHWAGPTELRVRLAILRGFHINAHDAGRR